MWKQLLNPQANATNLLQVTSDVACCCGDEVGKSCSYCFTVDFSKPLTSISINGTAVALTATDHMSLLVELKAALEANGFVDEGGVGTMATSNGAAFDFCVKGYAVLSDAINADGAVAIEQRCTSVIVCDYSSTTLDGSTPLVVDNVSTTLAGAPYVFGTTTTAAIEADVLTAFAGMQVDVTVQEVAALSAYKIIITAESGMSISFGEKDFEKCDCVQSMKV